MRFPALLIWLFAYTLALADPDDWITNYYRSPSPERFVGEVMILSEEGVLADERYSQNVAVFLSQVLAANPDKIDDWMDQLPTLPQVDTETLLLAIWLADVPESRDYLLSTDRGEFVENPPPRILDYEPMSPDVLDMWWAYFFATGSEEPVTLIVSALNLDSYVGALESYETSEKSDEDKRRVLNEAIFESARWSLESNVRQHQRVADIAEQLFWEEDLTNSEKLWLGAVLVKAMPEKYRMSEVEGGQRIERID